MVERCELSQEIKGFLSRSKFDQSRATETVRVPVRYQNFAKPNFGIGRNVLEYISSGLERRNHVALRQVRRVQRSYERSELEKAGRVPVR